MTTQLAVRIPDALAVTIDAAVATGTFASRTALVVAALERWAKADESRRIGEQIAEGYRKFPQTDEETAGVLAASRALIAEEPW